MKLRTNFLLKDLKTGMIVETRKGTLLLVLKGYLVNNDSWVSLNHYSEDLTRSKWAEDNFRDIMKVYTTNKAQTLEDMFKNKTLIWDRNYHKPMTIEDIEKELGYKIKIINK